ncbi:BON domain-containing protein [Candidatus Skiveiella danica]|jgi:osmotically-inducible protein OsmY|uniref:BON domain-containing protein n=1 Tax=Candidatus Skiveiella danica TaxID=3386177 RepID=UPI0039B821AE
MKNMNNARYLLGALAAAAIAVALGGCAAAVVGGAVAGGMVATDRRSTGAQVDDQNIELRASSSLSGTFGERSHINVTSYNAQVLITGEVLTEQDKQQAQQIVGKVPGVRSVVNELGVMPVTSFSQRSEDSLITAKVKASMVDASDVFGTLFKVVTERNTVYLMGRVTQAEANRATEIARSTSGVQRVVRVLEIVTEAQLQPPPPTPATPATPSAAPASAPKS